jgi:hypothetical protein
LEKERSNIGKNGRELQILARNNRALNTNFDWGPVASMGKRRRRAKMVEMDCLRMPEDFPPGTTVR